MFFSENKKRLWLVTFRQVLSLIMISVVLALTINHFRPGGITITGNWSMDASITDAGGNLMTISLEDAFKLYEMQEAVFIDARSQEQYLEGHIKGALSLPWQQVNDYFIDIVEQIDPQKQIITYCDGETCDLSHELALFLKDMGFSNSRVLVNGWSLWVKADFPVKSITDPDKE